MRRPHTHDRAQDSSWTSTVISRWLRSLWTPAVVGRAAVEPTTLLGGSMTVTEWRSRQDPVDGTVATGVGHHPPSQDQPHRRVAMDRRRGQPEASRHAGSATPRFPSFSNSSPRHSPLWSDSTRRRLCRQPRTCQRPGRHHLVVSTGPLLTTAGRGDRGLLDAHTGPAEFRQGRSDRRS